MVLPVTIFHFLINISSIFLTFVFYNAYIAKYYVIYRHPYLLAF